MSCLPRLRPFWIVVVCCLAPCLAPVLAWAGPGSGGTLSAPSGAPVQGRKKGSPGKKRRKHGKIGSHSPARSTALVHRRERRHPASGGATKPSHLVALAPSPGPAQTPEALRAMDNVRHLQLERAESAARREDLTNRWDTVNFLISGVDEQRYPEAGFWKVLSCYRRGRISEGDETRQRCRLSGADVRALDHERAVAALLTTERGATSASPLAGTTMAAMAAGRPEGVVNNAAYTGPGPTPDSTRAATP